VFYPSRTEDDRSEPFELQVARGLIKGHSLVNVFGYQSEVNSVFVPVWENATVYTYPLAATTMQIVSSSASDTAVSVRILGLNADYEPITEVITLNGTTPVSTIGSYFRINNLVTVSGNAVGTMTLSAGGVTYAKINAGVGRSQMSLYSVPAGYSFFLNRVDLFSNLSGGSGNHCLYRVQTDYPNGVNIDILQTPFTDRYEARRVVPFPYLEKTDIQWQAKAFQQTAEIGVVIEGILIRNEH
jgi:hypothetical protein